MTTLFVYLRADRTEELKEHFLKFKVVKKGEYDFRAYHQKHREFDFTPEQYQLKYHDDVIAYYKDNKLKLTDKLLDTNIYNKATKADVINKLNKYMHEAYVNGFGKVKLTLFGKYLGLKEGKYKFETEPVFVDEPYMFNYSTVSKLEERLTKWMGYNLSEEELKAVEKLIQVEEIKNEGD